MSTRRQEKNAKQLRPSLRPSVTLSRWPQCTNVTDTRTDRTGKDRQRSDSTGRTVFTARRSYASAVLGVENWVEKVNVSCVERRRGQRQECWMVSGERPSGRRC